MQNLVEIVPLLRNVYNYLGGESTCTTEGIYKIWWREYLYEGRYLENLVERVSLLRKVYIRLGGVGTFTHKTWWTGYLY